MSAALVLCVPLPIGVRPTPRRDDELTDVFCIKVLCFKAVVQMT